MNAAFQTRAEQFDNVHRVAFVKLHIVYRVTVSQKRIYLGELGTRLMAVLLHYYHKESINQFNRWDTVSRPGKILLQILYLVSQNQ